MSPTGLLHPGEPGGCPAGRLFLELMEFLILHCWVAFIAELSLGFNLFKGFAPPNLRGTGQHLPISCHLSTSLIMENELAVNGFLTTSQDEVVPGAGAWMFRLAHVPAFRVWVRAGESA